MFRMSSTSALENDVASDDKQEDITFKDLDMELLSGIYQRHHNIFQSTIMEVRPSLGLHEERLDQLIMSLSLVSTTFCQRSVIAFDSRYPS
jgi:hypothetical protein